MKKVFLYSALFFLIVLLVLFARIHTPEYLNLKIARDVDMKFRLVRGGSFLMGSAPGQGWDEEHPRHRVMITHDFYIGCYEVTQEQFMAVIGFNPSRFKGKHRPVESVTREEVEAFISKLNENDFGVYRLPTEAEWEYACRAGTDTLYHWGDTDESIVKFCNFADVNAAESSIFGVFDFKWADKSKNDRYDATAPVGSFRPNPWGLYDMYGNVWEWCSDWYDQDWYSRIKGLQQNPTGPETGEVHVIRGGSWGDSANCCRSANRAKPWDKRWWVLGFRLVYDP